MLEDGGARIYFHQGMAAGPTLLTTHDGGIREERRFEPFGQPINGTLNKHVDPMNNLNKETNPDTGWSYHGARWMAPQTARWQTPDPPVKAPDGKFLFKPWSLNPYSYVGQSPTQYWDPDGLNEAPTADENKSSGARAYFSYASPTLHGPRELPVFKQGTGEKLVFGTGKNAKITQPWELTKENQPQFEKALKQALSARFEIPANRITLERVTDRNSLQQKAAANARPDYTVVGTIMHGWDRRPGLAPTGMGMISPSDYLSARALLTQGGSGSPAEYVFACYAIQNGFAPRVSQALDPKLSGKVGVSATYGAENLGITLSAKDQYSPIQIDQVSLPPTRPVDILDVQAYGASK